MKSNNDLTISTDKSKLDIPFISDYLINESYWANKRNVDQIKKSIEHSHCFGLFDKDQQIGFARVITDQIVFSYLMDVFVDKKYRGQGVGQFFMKEIYENEILIEVEKHYLITKDAQEFYKKYGFDIYPTPEKFMIKINNPYAKL